MNVNLNIKYYYETSHTMIGIVANKQPETDPNHEVYHNPEIYNNKVFTMKLISLIQRDDLKVDLNNLKINPTNNIDEKVTELKNAQQQKKFKK